MSSTQPAVRRRSFTQLARDEGINLATPHRWRHPGILVPKQCLNLPGSGKVRVRLRATRIGGRWWVDDEAWHEFLAALNADRTEPADSTPRSPAARSRASEHAERELIAEGL